MDNHEPSLKEMARRNEHQIKLIQALVGAVCGALFALCADAATWRYRMAYVHAWELVLALVIGALVGGIAGYHTDTWRSSLER